MYGNCGSLQRAKELFDKIPEKDLVSWTAIMSAYARNGHGNQALNLFREMKTQGVKPDAFTFSSVLDACASIKGFHQGKYIHVEVRNAGLEMHPVVANSLMNMYARCGCLTSAKNILETMSGRSAVSWNTMIAAYAREGHYDLALQLYRDMDVEPTAATFVSALSACSSSMSLSDGKMIHGRVRKTARLEDNPLVVSALIDMYGSCDRLTEARKLFEKKRLRSVHVWSSIVSAHTKGGEHETGLKLYKEMVAQGIQPDGVTFVVALNVCMNLRSIEEGVRIHKLIPAKILRETIHVGNSLVNLYAKCGCMEEARRVFESMNRKDIVTWNTLLSSYAQQGNGSSCTELYHRMISETLGFQPNEITFHAVIDACTESRDLRLGRRVHSDVRERGMLTDWLATSLVEMYARCGRLTEAEELILDENMPSSWTAVLAGYALNGESAKVVELHREMELGGVRVDGVTYVSLLSACSHGGLMREGCCYFCMMGDDRGVEPLAEHYACVVDTVARAGWLHEAGVFIEQLPVEPDAEVYMALLAACRTQKDVGLGVEMAKRVLQLNPVHRGAYSLLYNLILGD